MGEIPAGTVVDDWVINGVVDVAAIGAMVWWRPLVHPATSTATAATTPQAQGFGTGGPDR
jgi:hypothetical protein